MTKIISGTQLAKELREEIKNEAAALREKGVEPTLTVVLPIPAFVGVIAVTSINFDFLTFSSSISL